MSRLRRREIYRKGKHRAISIVRRCIVGGTIIAAFVCITFSAISISRLAQPTVLSMSSDTSQEHYSNKPDQAFDTEQKAQTDSRTFYIGDSIAMPNGLKLRVIKVLRNWQPPAAVSASYGSLQDGDNSAGREIIAVWFQATNVGTSPIGYNDSMLTLQVTGQPEQRMAHLASLLPSAFGDRGVEPWLLPSQSKETFVPFLVSPNAILESFQYYVPPSYHSFSSPTFTLTRLSIFLQAPRGRSPTEFVFKTNKTVTVG